MTVFKEGTVLVASLRRAYQHQLLPLTTFNSYVHTFNFYTTTRPASFSKFLD